MRSIVLLLVAGCAFAQPEISFDAADILKLPEHIYMGEAAGVATNSKGHIFVYTRTGDAYATIGTSRTFSHGGGRLFEFDRTGKFVKEIGQGSYALLFPQSVRVDAQDNIWIVDRGSNMVIKFDPSGRVLMPMGRKPEEIFVGARGPARSGTGGAAAGPGAPAAPGRGRGNALPGAGSPGDLFNQPADIAFDSAGNIFVADGFGNSRVAKFDKNGWYIKSWGSRGSEPSQFDGAQSIAVDSAGNVYVADHGNKRIQVFDNDGAFKTALTGVGSPWAVCISPGPHQFLYSSNSNAVDSMDGGEIYKMELDGRVLGKFGRAGKVAKEFGTVNSIDCRESNELFVGEITNWRVQKLTLHP